MRKRSDPLDFSASILSQKSKQTERGPIATFFPKKVSQCRKKTERGPFNLVWYCMCSGKPFWFRSLGQQIQFGVFLKFCRTFGRTILVTSGVSKKTLTKSHNYSGLFSQEMRRVKTSSACNSRETMI